MNKTYNVAGVLFGMAAWVLLSVVAVYSGTQADKISSLNDSIAQQQKLINALNQGSDSASCIATSVDQIASSDQNTDDTRLAQKPNSKQEPIPYTSSSNITVTAISELTYSQYPDEDDTEDESEEDVNPQSVRAFFNDLFDEADITAYSDEALLEQGSELLEQHIENEASDFESSLSAAYALNELTNEPIPEHLSQTLLQKASQSESEEELMDTLLLIGDQQYSDSSFLATDLMASANADARMVGIYLLATDQESGQSGAALANQLYANPEETIEILGQLIGE